MIKLSFIGAAFFLILAFAALLANSFYNNFKLFITFKPLYIFIFIFFSVLFVFLWEIRILGQSKSLYKNIEETFTKASDEAGGCDWQMVEDIIKKAKKQKQILLYNENKIKRLIEKRQDSSELIPSLIRISAISIIVISIYIFLPFNVVINNIFSRDIKVLSSVLALLSAVGAGIVLLFEFINTSNLEYEISKYKSCLYLLQQAQLLLNNIEGNRAEKG